MGVGEPSLWWDQRERVWSSQGPLTMDTYGTCIAGAEGVLCLSLETKGPEWRPSVGGTRCQALSPSAGLPRPGASSGLRETPPSSSRILHPWSRFCLHHQGATPGLLVTWSWVNIKWFEALEALKHLLFGEQIFPLIIFYELLAVHTIPHIYFCTCSQPTDVVIAEVNPWFRNLGQKNYGFSFSCLM